MTKRYQIWNGTDNIVLLKPHNGKVVFTPAEFVEVEPLSAVPGAKFIISTALTNGAVIMEVTQTAEVYRQAGADIPEYALPLTHTQAEEIMDAIIAFEDAQAAAGVEAAERERAQSEELHAAQVAAAEAQERLAAAQEFQNLLNM